MLKHLKKTWNQWTVGTSALSFSNSTLLCNFTSWTPSHWCKEGQWIYSESLHSILYSLGCCPHILLPMKYWNAEDTVVNIILTPLCCLFQIYCCAPEAVMSFFSPYYCRISVYLSVYLLGWLQMGKLRLESSGFRFGVRLALIECVYCALFIWSTSSPDFSCRFMCTKLL